MDTTAAAPSAGLVGGATPGTVLKNQVFKSLEASIPTKAPGGVSLQKQREEWQESRKAHCKVLQFCIKKEKLTFVSYSIRDPEHSVALNFLREGNVETNLSHTQLI